MADEFKWLDSLPKREGWEKTELAVVRKQGPSVLVLRDKKGELLVKWATKSAQTQANLTKLVKAHLNKTGCALAWHVRWFRDGETRWAEEVLDESQYAEAAKLRWQNKKVLMHGFSTANPHLA